MAPHEDREARCRAFRQDGRDCREGDADAASPGGCGACPTGDRLAVHRADDRPAAGDQHLPADLDDPAVLHQLPGQPAQCRSCANVGLDNYTTILTDPDVWAAMQATAHFVFWTILLQTVLGFGFTLAWLIDKKFRGHAFWTTVILHPDDAVAGGGRELLALPLPAADRALQLRRSFFTGAAAVVVRDARRRDAGALGDHHRRYLDVDALRDADLPRRPALDPRLHL